MYRSNGFFLPLEMDGALLGVMSYIVFMIWTVRGIISESFSAGVDCDADRNPL